MNDPQISEQDWMTVEQLCEHFWGENWKEHPEYKKAQQWVINLLGLNHPAQDHR